MTSHAAAGTLDLSEVADLARGTLWGCWRFRWRSVGLAWGVAVVGWIIVALIPDVHQASARVYVDMQNSLRPLLEGLAVNSDVMSEVNMMERAIMSRPNLERLARETDMDIDAKDRVELDRLIEQLQASIKTQRDGNNIIRISYENNDRDRALAVVTSLLNMFVEGSLGKARQDSSSAEEFLLQQISDYERRLNEAESRLADFKRKNVGLMPDAQADYYGRLQQSLARLQETEGKLRVARNRRAELERQVEGEEPVFGLVPADPKTNLLTTPQDRQIAQFEQQLAELRLKYTETYPGIVEIKRTIEALRAEKEAQLAKENAAGRKAYSPLDLNPVYQQMKIQLSRADVELAQLQAEYSDQAAIVAGLRQKVDVVPAIEAELKRLNRDYDVTKAQYDQLLRRLESARLSEAADERKGDVTFRIIDPPTVPALPVGPKRGLLVSGVLVLALLAGLCLAVALHFMNPVFYTGRELERRFGVPVLGMVRLARTDAEQAQDRRQATWVLAGVGGLFGVYVLTLGFFGMVAGS